MKLFRILFFILIFANCAYADSDFSKVTVTGSSKISLEAQYSIIHANLKFVKKDIDQSYKELHQTLSIIIKNLKKFGLLDKEITKSIVRQGSEYTWQNNSRKHLGYYSTCSLQLRINDLNKLHSIYSELSKFDSLTIHGTEYGRNDKFEKRNVELKKALLAAKEKAQLMAKTLNVEIGSVFSIQETGSQNVHTRKVYENRVSSDRSGGTFGTVDITASVIVEFKLK